MFWGHGGEDRIYCFYVREIPPPGLIEYNSKDLISSGSSPFKSGPLYPQSGLE